MTTNETRDTHEAILTMLEHAIEHNRLATNADNGNDRFDACHILIQAHKAVGPWGKFPSWERRAEDDMEQDRRAGKRG